MNYKWNYSQPTPEETAWAEQIAAQQRIHPALAQLLPARGVTTQAEANKFFRPQLTDLHDPFLMDDMQLAVRAVRTVDFMTAEAAEIPFEVLQRVMSRIINEVKGVNRVFYDLTSKPPGTIEFE